MKNAIQTKNREIAPPLRGLRLFVCLLFQQLVFALDADAVDLNKAKYLDSAFLYATVSSVTSLHALLSNKDKENGAEQQLWKERIEKEILLVSFLYWEKISRVNQRGSLLYREDKNVTENIRLIVRASVKSPKLRDDPLGVLLLIKQSPNASESMRRARTSIEGMLGTPDGKLDIDLSMFSNQAALTAVYRRFDAWLSAKH